MKIIDSKDGYQIAGMSLALKGKSCCGDHIVYAEISSEQLVVLALSDGVGSLHHDCDASRTACESFIESFTCSTIPDILTRFQNALKDADKAVSEPSDPGKKGMMSTFIGVVWDKAQNDILYSSIGDSRLYRHSGNGLAQLSTDEKKAVLMRDKSGKLLSQSGVLIVREGLTNALGYNGASINIITEIFDDGNSLVLCTDGMYEMPDFEDGITESLTNSDLDKAIDFFFKKNSDVFGDDASILILQRTFLPNDVIPKIRKAIDENLSCADLEIPLHLVTRWIMEESLNLISTKESLNLEKITKYITKNDLRLSEAFIMKAIEKMKENQFLNTLFYNMLIGELKRLKW
jgi:serine/threonine protein phosphatase PrpC